MSQTMTKTRRVKESLRSLRIGDACNGYRALVLSTGGERVGYYLRELAVDFGRGFELVKFDTDEGTDAESNSYHVHLDAETGDSCTCKGFIYHRHGKPCKHIDALKTLVSMGKV